MTDWHIGLNVEATNKLTGISSTFVAVEHFNIGKGWMMLDALQRHKGLVSSHDLTDICPTQPS